MKINPVLLNTEYVNNIQKHNNIKNQTQAAADNSSLMMNYLSFQASLGKSSVRPPREIRMTLNSANGMNLKGQTLTILSQAMADEAVEKTKEISTITRMARREIGTTQSLFDKPQQGAVLKIETGENGFSVLRQCNKKGDVIRTGYFQNGKVWRVEKNKKDGTPIDIMVHDDKILSYKEGLCHRGGGKNTADMSILYLEGVPVMYKENAKFYENGKVSASKKIDFKDGKPVFYAEDSLEYQTGEKRYGKSLKIVDDRAFEYEENSVTNSDLEHTSTSYLKIEDNLPVQYDEICSIDKDGNRLAMRRVLYEGENMKQFQASDLEGENCIKSIDFHEGSPVEYKATAGVVFNFKK